MSCKNLSNNNRRASYPHVGRIYRRYIQGASHAQFKCCKGRDKEYLNTLYKKIFNERLNHLYDEYLRIA